MTTAPHLSDIPFSLREGSRSDLMLGRIEELADMILAGETDAAYEILRESFPGLQPIKFRRELLAARKATS